MKIGILRETKIPTDKRVPLSPEQCKQIEKDYPGIKIIVEPGNDRCFTDQEYVEMGIEVKDDLSDCDVLMGVKEVDPERLIPDKTYFFFSHTIKKQSYNKRLLKNVLDKRVRLVDYETLTDNKGNRIIGFGRWAGLVGTYTGIRAMCIRQNQCYLPHPQEYKGLDDMMIKASCVALPPLRIVLTGNGRVAGGAVEMLDAFDINRVTLEEYLDTTDNTVPIYVQLDPGQYNRRKQEKSFDLQHFFKNPLEYESHFERFCDKTDVLIMAAYWDPLAPVLFTPEQMREESFSIRIIADITCDINGSAPTTIRTTDFTQPYYDINRSTGEEETPFSDLDNITVMAIDNLPCGLPTESSKDFGQNIIKNILPLFLFGDMDGLLERATIAQNGKLTVRFNYLEDWVNGKE